MSKEISGGLNPTPIDNRDFRLEKVFGKIPIMELPEEDFTVAEPLFIEDQKGSDYCAACAASSVMETTEKIDLDPLYAFAKAKQISGEWRSWGLDLRTICKAMVKFGCIAKKDSPYTINDKRETIANWENWPKDLDFKASFHRQKSYFRVDI